MKKKRKISKKKHPKATSTRPSLFTFLLIFCLGVGLAFAAVYHFPRLAPRNLKPTIRQAAATIQQWKEKLWPTPDSTSRRPATGTSTSRPITAKQAHTTPPPATLYVTLYKASPDYSSLTTTTKLLQQDNDRQRLARQIFSELTRNEPGAKSPLPPGVKLLAVDFSGRVITLNLSPEIATELANSGSSDEIQAVYGLVNTYLKNFPDCTEVKITVAGRSVKTLAGHLDIEKPLQFFPL